MHKKNPRNPTKI